MANKGARVLEFKLNDDDYKAFGRYRIQYTAGGRKMVNRMRLTYIIMGAGVAALFSVFHVDPLFTKVVYVISALMVVYGVFFAEGSVIKQQDRAIDASKNDVERVHPANNIIKFYDDSFTTSNGGDASEFSYDAIKLIDLTESAIYIWMSDQMIMTLPLHAFRDLDEMKEMYKWIKAKTENENEDDQSNN